mmetsp:Transcript_19507/g.64480  ORF Transcript_19507/g.64480 Transcript_19507/m.64480 type:complete len:205 (+) Transcript_19507:1029-1643(+)
MPLDPEGSEAQGGARESRRRARAAAGDGRDGLRQRAADSDGADARLGLHAARRAPPARGAARRGRGGLRRLGERPLLDGAPDCLLLAPVARLPGARPRRQAVPLHVPRDPRDRRAGGRRTRRHLRVGRLGLHPAARQERATAVDQLAAPLRLAAALLRRRHARSDAPREPPEVRPLHLPLALLVPRRGDVALGSPRRSEHVLRR